MKKTYQTPGILVKEVKIQKPLAASPNSVKVNDEVVDVQYQLSKQTFVSFIGGWDDEE